MDRESGLVKEFYAGRPIVVTGGAGFIGSTLVDHLVRTRGVSPSDIGVPRSAELDLRRFENAQRALDGAEIVFHLAAPTGGIAYSRSHPASQYVSCALIDVNVLEAARLAGVSKVIMLGNLLAYPAAAPSPLREEGLHDGRIADTHLGIGLAKRNLVLLGEMYHREYGMDVATVLSANAYGPRDRFDVTISHVIPATIMKCFDDSAELVVWGDGTPTRDFLYVEDIAEGLALAGEHLAGPEFVNLASGREVSIRELVHTIADLCGYTGQIRFDATKAGGDPRRSASTERATRLLQFAPRYTFEEGLRRTIDWYRSEVRASRAVP
jgi:GDP-L-fucose synthase